MTFDEFKKKWLSKTYQENTTLWKQCVALIKLYATEVDGIQLWWFSWSALKWWWTGSPFKLLPYTRVNYNGKGIPPRGSIIFFSATNENQYWHVAIAGQCNKDEVWVIEQNAITGNGRWLWGDAISIRSYPYSGGKVGNVLWWYTCTMQF